MTIFRLNFLLKVGQMKVCQNPSFISTIVQRVRDCVRNGNYHTLDPASIVENGLLLKFFKKILM